MKSSVIKEYFLYRLYYKKDVMALDEFHEFVDHVNNYGLEYKDILIYRKNFSIALSFKEQSLTWRCKKFFELMEKEVKK